MGGWGKGEEILSGVCGEMFFGRWTRTFVCCSRRLVRRMESEGSVMSIVSKCIQLRGGNDSCFKLYPFRGRGSPSFSIDERGRVCCYFKYKTKKGIFAFLVRCRGFSFMRTIGFLTSETKVRLPRVRCSGRTGRGTSLGSAVLRVGGLTTGCFCMRLGSRHKDRTCDCLGGHRLSSRAVATFKLKFSGGCDSSLCGCLERGKCDRSLVQRTKLVGASRHRNICSGF